MVSNVSGELERTTTEGDLTLILDGMDPGDHRITITVSDDDEEAIIWFETTVEPRPDVNVGGPGSYFVVIIIVAILVAIAVVSKRWR